MKIIPFCASEYSTEYSTGQKYHHHHHRVDIMGLGHLLTLSGLTHPKSRQWSSLFLSAFWCAVIFVLSSVIRLHIVSNVFRIPVFCPKQDKYKVSYIQYFLLFHRTF